MSLGHVKPVPHVLSLCVIRDDGKACKVGICKGHLWVTSESIQPKLEHRITPVLYGRQCESFSFELLFFT